jgi:hypothetical protein
MAQHFYVWVVCWELFFALMSFRVGMLFEIGANSFSSFVCFCFCCYFYCSQKQSKQNEKQKTLAREDIL